MMEVPESGVPAIVKLHLQHGGTTYSLRWGDLSNVALYVVSLYPDLGLILPGKRMDEAILSQFIQENRELLADPRCVVGTWFNPEDGNTYLDVSAVFSDRDVAIQLAKLYNQIAIWDLKNGKEIIIGGSGAPPNNLPKAGDRLPQKNVR